MVSIPAQFAYPAFALWTALFTALIWWWKPELRKQMIFMIVCGAIGGLVVGTRHHADFWNLPSWGDVYSRGLHVSPWDAVFGGAFTGIATVLFQLFGAYHLEAETVSPSYARARREAKVTSLILVGAAGLVYSTLVTESVRAVSVTFLLGVGILYWSSNRLFFLAIQGGLVTLAVYVAIIGPFLLFVENRRELAGQFCQYYVTHGALWTALELSVYIAAYGAFVTPLYAWIKNLRFVDGIWRRS